MYRYTFLVTFICISMINCISNELPDYLPRCFIDDPNINNCLFKAFNTVKPYLKKGIKEIGILPFDPLVMSTFSISQENDNTNFTATVWNYTISGMDNYDINKISYDVKSLIFSTKMKFDPLSIFGICQLAGHILNITVDGKGALNATLGPINATIDIKGELIDIEGTDYYNTTEIEVILEIENASFHLDGVFKDSGINKKLKEFSSGVTQAVIPFTEQLTEERFASFMKSFTGSIPYYKIFPKSEQNK